MPSSKITRDVTPPASGPTEDLERRLAEATKTIDEQRNQLRTMEEKADSPLFDAIETMSEGFALFDDEDRLQLFNRRYVEEIWPQIADILVIGVTFETIIRETIKRGVWEGSDIDLETLVEAAMARHRDLPSVHEISYPNGRWIRQSKRRTASGGVLAVYADITERVRERRADRRLAAIVESSIDAIIGTTAEGIVTDWNPAAAQMYGYMAEEIIGEPLSIIAPPHLQSEFQQNLNTFLSGSHLEAFETIRRRKDGSLIDVSLSFSLIKDEAGTVIGFSAIHRDITENKRVEHALRESEERFAFAVRGTNDGLWDLNFDADEYYASPRWKAIVGYEEDELEINRNTFHNLLHPDDVDRVTAAARAHFEERVPYNQEFRLRCKDGEYVWVQSKGQAVWDEDGKPLRMAGSFRDISDRKQVEEALRESEAQLRLVTDSIPMSIAYIDPDHIVRFANLPYAEWQGYSQDGIIGMHLRDVRGQEWFDTHLPDTKRTLAGEITSLEGNRTLKDGRNIFFRATRVPHFGKDDEVLGYFIILIDLTEDHEREAQLRQSQKMEAVGQLTGGIAHEFNNLLMVIVGNLELISDRASDDTTRKLTSTAMRGAMRGADLTSQLLAFSRKQNLKVEPVDLNSLVRGMHEMLQRTLGETVSVDAELSDDMWPVLADRSLLESVLLNLALNSRDAMPAGGKITITTSNQVVDAALIAKHPNIGPGDYVILEVVDTGSGIAPDDLEHVFEPFFTTKDVGEGTGLGLSMVHGFVEQSGGFVNIESQLGKGTSLRIYLPRAAEPAAHSKADKQRSPHVPLHGATVLVVEDEPDVRQIVVGILSSLGCNVLEAEDGKSALSRMDEHPEINVLFTDVVLPGDMSGHNIASEARHKIADLKIVFTSGYPDNEFKDLAGDEQTSFIRKPYRITELAKLLDRVLQS